MLNLKSISVITLASLTCACATNQPRFEWGTYENSLYQYYRTPETRAAYEESLVKAIEKGERTQRVAPGLNAELGYLHWENGNYEQAREYFLREAELFPESRQFLNAYLGGEQAHVDTETTSTAAHDAAPTS